MTIDSGVDKQQAICNKAVVAGSSDIDQVCVLVDYPVGTGALRGVVFRDVGADDRKLAEEEEEARLEAERLESSELGAIALLFDLEGQMIER